MVRLLGAAAAVACAASAFSLDTTTFVTAPTHLPAAIVARQGDVARPAEVGDFQRVGCFQSFDEAVATFAEDMTLEVCAASCAGLGTFFAVQNGESCFCGNASGTTQLDEAECNVPCGGDTNVFCGGISSLAVYGPEGPDVENPDPENPDPENPDPTDPPANSSPVIVGNYNRLGCYSSTGPDGLTLSGEPRVDPSLTLQACATTCQGFRYFGASEGNTCYCSDELSNPSSLPRPDADCSTPCGGDASIFCGGVDRLALYDRGTDLRPAVVGPYFRRGCRTTSGLQQFARSTSSTDMTLQVCATFCDGLRYFGVVDGQTCLCDDDSLNATDVADEDQCSLPCFGDQEEYCGGSSFMALYDQGEGPEDGDGDGDGDGGEDGGEDGQGDPRPPDIGPFKRLGCQSYSTDIMEDPSFDGQNFEGFDMSLDLCAEMCSEFRYFATYFRFRCACRNELRGNSALVPEVECDQTCLGNMTQICSGNRRLVVYDKEAEAVSPTSTIISSTDTSTVVTEPTGESTTFFLSIGDNDIDLPSGGEEAPTSPPIRHAARNNWKRQNEDVTLVGDSGPVTLEECATATRFTLLDGDGGRLEANDVPVATAQDITFIALSPLDVPPNALINAGFALVGDELVWLNPSFFGGRAGFCLDDQNTLFATFTDPEGTDYPLNCVATSLHAVSTGIIYAALDSSITTSIDASFATSFAASFSTTITSTFNGTLRGAINSHLGSALVPSISGTLVPLVPHSVSCSIGSPVCGCAFSDSLRSLIGHLISATIHRPFDTSIGAAVISTVFAPLVSLLQHFFRPAIGVSISAAIVARVTTGVCT